MAGEEAVVGSNKRYADHYDRLMDARLLDRIAATAGPLQSLTDAVGVGSRAGDDRATSAGGARMGRDAGGFRAVMALGTDHPHPPRFWLLVVGSMLLVPVARWALQPLGVAW